VGGELQQKRHHRPRCPGGRLFIPRRNRPQDAGVHSRRPRNIHLPQVSKGELPRQHVKAAHESLQELVACRLAQNRVDIARDTEVQLPVADHGCVFDGLRELQHGRPLADIGTPRRQAYGLLLQRGTRLQQLHLPRIRHLEDEDRGPRPDRHQPLPGEALQRLADWRAADAGLLR